jgi:hypothetical protein
MTPELAAGRRVLLDEMLPRFLATELPGHSVSTVAQEGWAGVVNGDLLSRCEAAGFDVFVTADRNMEYQQRLGGRTFGVVVIAAGGTKPADLLAVAVAFRTAVEQVSAGQIRYVSRAGPTVQADSP